MNREQLKHLQTRIARHKTAVMDAAYSDADEPAAVQRARAVVLAHMQKRNARNESVRDTLMAAARQVEAVMLFGDPAKALAAVEAFEKFYPFPLNP